MEHLRMVEARKIIIVDDHPLYRTALRQAVSQAFGGAVECIEAESFTSVRTAVEEHADADLLLLDLHLPGAHGFSALVYLRTHSPALPVVVVSARQEPQIIRRAIEHGAAGFIPKSATLEEISQALRRVLAGEVWLPPDVPGTEPTEVSEGARRLSQLTPQQLRVLMMLSDGLLNKQIAYELNVSEATIKAHVTAILRKLGASNRTQAVVLARELEVEPPGDAQELLQPPE